MFYLNHNLWKVQEQNHRRLTVKVEEGKLCHSAQLHVSHQPKKIRELLSEETLAIPFIQSSLKLTSPFVYRWPNVHGVSVLHFGSVAEPKAAGL